MGEREKEFLAAKEELTPTLFKKFYRLAQLGNVKDDRKSFVEDMVALTILESLINSLKERHARRNCRDLIKMKARNVWADYWRKRKNSFDHANHLDLEMEWKEDLNTDPVDPAIEKIEMLLEEVDEKSKDIIQKRLEGYELKEIAAMYGKTEGSLSMHIQRLKKKIQKRS